MKILQSVSNVTCAERFHLNGIQGMSCQVETSECSEHAGATGDRLNIMRILLIFSRLNVN